MTKRAFHLTDPRGAHARLAYAALAGAIAYFVVPLIGHELSPISHALIAGEVGGLTLIGIVLAIILRADAEETRRRAAAQDPGRTTVWVLVLVASAFALFTVVFGLHAKTFDPGERDLVLGLSVGAVAISWVLTHTGFTLRYAHLYYREGREDEGGIDFPACEDASHEDPDDLDFMYFAFTIGMCFQVSDATIKRRVIRHTALAHALISFVYNTGIVALVINVVLG